MKHALLLILLACGNSKPKPAEDPKPPPATAGDCIKTGCSATICTEPGKDVVTTCEFKPEYACYRDATCERQGDGTCGWTSTPKLTDCLAHPPAGDAASTPQ
jgi:hypothetical protein